MAKNLNFLKHIEKFFMIKYPYLWLDETYAIVKIKIL
jgi:hypothetical protein